MKVPIAKTKLTVEEYNIISQPLKNGWLVQGEFVRDFENKFSEFTGIKNSIAVTSCTTALHLSLSALGFKKDDEAIVPAFTWISTANVVEHLGGKVVFCDIDLKTFNIDVEKIESLITPKTKAIIPVHLFGLPAEMNKILQLAEKYNLFVIEDAACGFGSEYHGQHVGSFGKTGCFSFHPRKAITTGEGGMITTNDDNFAEKLRSMRDHGASITDHQRHHGAKPYLLADYPFAGFNYRMTDIQASIGSTQMERAKVIIDERRKIGLEYNLKFKDLNFFQLPFENNDFLHSYQSYPCIYDIKRISLGKIKSIKNQRNLFMDNLQKDGVSTRPATHAVHMLKYYSRKYGCKPEDYPNARIANDCSISLPLYNGLKKEEQNYVVQKIKAHLQCVEL
tara:strand:- start:4581 stop:5759 length:1179 start_codon:yes stop_codon:yes gene_type:complete